MPDVLAPPLAISIRDVSAAAADSVAKLPSRYRPFIPAHPNYRIGFVRPWWWIGVVIVPPEMENIALNDVHGLAAEVHAGIAQTVDGVRNAKPGVVLGDGFLTIGFAPPNEFDVIEAQAVMRRTAEQPLKCPSAQPGMGDVQILGVISRDAEEPRLAYLDEALPATPETLELAAPLDPSQVFRLSARCEEKKCTHFDGVDCQLAVRIAKMLPEVVDHLPACNIRRDCRWFRQEGRAACVRCPQIVTGIYDADATLQQVAGVPPRSN